MRKFNISAVSEYTFSGNKEKGYLTAVFLDDFNIREKVYLYFWITSAFRNKILQF